MNKKNYSGFFPVFMALFVIPLAIRLIPVEIPKSVFFNWNMQDMDYDIFSYFRVILLLINTVFIIVFMFFKLDKKNTKIFKNQKYLLYPFFAMVIISIISSFLGDMSLSFMGAPQRYEGILTYISYFALFLYTLTMDFDKTTKKCIFATFSAFTVICFIVGISQLLGKNILTTEFVKKLYISSDILKNAKLVDKDLGFKNMYILTSHYNYASMLASMLSAFFLTYFIREDEKKTKYISLIMAVLSLVMLFGSNGRSGIVSFLFTMIIMFIVFFKDFVKSKKSLIFFAVFIVLMTALALKFDLMSRFTSMIGNGQKIEKNISDDRAYIKDKIDLKDIKCKKDGYEINYKNTVLKFDRNKSIFTDEKGNPLVFKMPQKGRIIFDNKKYKDFSLTAMTKKMPAMDKPHMIHEFKFGKNTFSLDLSDPSGIKLINLFGKPMYPEKVKKIGFKGMEKLGSGRFYIISATLPMILKSPVFGYGADGFINNFNQDDIYSKLYIYQNAYEIIDKPHNLFLLYSVDFGLIFTAIFIYMVVYTLILIKRKNVKDPVFISAYALVLSYFISGFFNDSVVSISPIFWVMFAISILGIEKGGNN